MPRFRRPRSPVHALRRAAAALLAVMALALALRPEAAPAAQRSEQRLPVVVAVHDLAAGTVLTATELRTTRLPPAYVPAGVVPDAASLVGRVVAGAVRAGEPLTDVRLVGQGLTRLLQDHEVAAPVRLADLAVAALVRTGDRVDVLATPADAGRADVIATDALVLAAPAPPREEQGPADPSAGLLVLAVDAATAERLAAAATTSSLTVSLPPP
jgi:pilus assembly protein CpaB